jgi:hypothetical protein
MIGKRNWILCGLVFRTLGTSQTFDGQMPKQPSEGILFRPPNGTKRMEPQYAAQLS